MKVHLQPRAPAGVRQAMAALAAAWSRFEEVSPVEDGPEAVEAAVHGLRDAELRLMAAYREAGREVPVA